MFPDAPTMTVPLRMDEHGVIRVSGTRVTLDSIINYYRQGESPEDLHEGFPTVPLTDIYSIIAYYLVHRDELDAYIKSRAEEEERIRQEAESSYTQNQRMFSERLRGLAEERRREQNH